MHGRDQFNEGWWMSRQLGQREFIVPFAVDRGVKLEFSKAPSTQPDSRGHCQNVNGIDAKSGIR
jgi:hypothetical protein